MFEIKIPRIPSVSHIFLRRNGISCIPYREPFFSWQNELTTPMACLTLLSHTFSCNSFIPYSDLSLLLLVDVCVPSSFSLTLRSASSLWYPAWSLCSIQVLVAFDRVTQPIYIGIDAHVVRPRGEHHPVSAVQFRMLPNIYSPLSTSRKLAYADAGYQTTR